MTRQGLIKGRFGVNYVVLGVIVSVIALLSISNLAHASSATSSIKGIAKKCMDVEGGKASSHHKVQLYTCNSTKAQQWKRPGDGTIRNQSYCLDIKYGQLVSKTSVWLYDCNGTKAQQWKMKADGSIVNPTSGLCLDDIYGATSNGNGFWLYKCNETKAQKWAVPKPKAIKPAPKPAPKVAPAVVTPQPKPQPKPATPSCDPNYSGACVPIASDVDCEGGSGNGPKYVYGIVHIVGSDIYDLDRDGDGLGCE